MSTMSHTELIWLLEELEPRLKGSRVRNIHDNGSDTIYLRLRSHSSESSTAESFILACSTHPQFCRLHEVPDRPRALLQGPLPFTSLLRKWIEGRRVDKITLSPSDRLIEVQLSSSEPDTHILIAELTGRRANLILVQTQRDHRVILGALKNGTSSRPLQPGTTYSSPPHGLPTASSKLNRFNELHARTGTSRSHAIDTLYTQLLAGHDLEARHTQLLRLATRELKRSERTRAAIENDLERAYGADVYRHEGDLLAANFRLLRRGMTSVQVEDFLDEMRPRVIELDPMRSPQGNLEATYRRYRKYQRAQSHLEARYEAIEARHASLVTLLNSSPHDPEHVEALTRQLQALGIQTRAPDHQLRREAEARRNLPYRSFASISGRAIWVGRSARHNDALTFSHARGNDLWLHAAGRAGSHVIVRLSRDESIEQDTLLDAATLAAHYGKGRADSLVEVHYTHQKYVRKVRGVAGGVTMAQAKIFVVRIDEARIGRLMKSS